MAGTGRKELALSYLLAGESVKDAAHRSGIGERTLFRWLGEPKFSQALKSAQDELVSRASRSLLARCEDAINTLKELIDKSYPGNVRLKAAQAILALALTYHEASEVERRLAALESGDGEIIVSWKERE